MSRVPIKDGQFRIVGYVDTEANGKQRALNARYRIVGHYDPATNETKDATYRIVARGNALAALIWGA
jgi:hypothetical protein